MNTYKRIVPTHFTSHETGEWKRYKGSGFTKEDLTLATDIPISLENSAEINNGIVLTATLGETRYLIHALAFADPALGTGRFARWDRRNGWTTTRLAANARMGKYND